MTELEKLQQKNAELKKRLEKYEKPKSIFEMRLKQARKAKGFSQKQLGEKVGKTQNAINLYENSSRLINKIKTLVLIADALNVSLDWLCGRTDKMSGV